MGDSLDHEPTTCAATPASPGAGQGESLAEKLSKIVIRMPTEAERRESGRMWYERLSHTFIDRWPEELRALSFPTKLIPVDAERLGLLWDDHPDAEQIAAELAAQLDAEMGWREWFIRLNSRSPKDACYPSMPITCAGKQAVSWIWASERCLDDAVQFANSGEQMYVCLREARPLLADAEVRCFAKGGRLLAVSRYFYDRPAERDLGHAETWEAARSFYDTHLVQHFDDIVFDLHLADPSGAPLLIEINPYGLSDPCCFENYQAIEHEGGVRFAPPLSTEEPIAGDRSREEPCP